MGREGKNFEGLDRKKNRHYLEEIDYWQNNVKVEC